MRIKRDDNASKGFISGSGTTSFYYYYYYCYYWEQMGRDEEIENKKGEQII